MHGHARVCSQCKGRICTAATGAVWNSTLWSDFPRCIVGPARGDDLDGGVTPQRRRDPSHMWKKVEEGWTERLFWGFFYARVERQMPYRTFQFLSGSTLIPNYTGTRRHYGKSPRDIDEGLFKSQSHTHTHTVQVLRKRPTANTITTIF